MYSPELLNDETILLRDLPQEAEESLNQSGDPSSNGYTRSSITVRGIGISLPPDLVVDEILVYQDRWELYNCGELVYMGKYRCPTDGIIRGV
jgi:hypothetical protein